MQNLAKRLPRDSKGRILPVFRANKVSYTIRRPEETLTGERWQAYNKLKPLFAYNFGDLRSFNNALSEIDKELGLMATASKPELFTSVVARVKALISEAHRLGTQKYDLAQMVCTIFIVRDNEDLTKFDMAMANQKIEDWNKEGYFVGDFLSLVAIFSPDLNEVLTANLRAGMSV